MLGGLWLMRLRLKPGVPMSEAEKRPVAGRFDE